MHPQVIFSAMEKTALIVIGNRVEILNGNFKNTEAAEEAARKQFPDLFEPIPDRLDVNNPSTV